MTRRADATLLELMLGLIAISYGISAMIPNRSILWRLMQDTGGSVFWMLGLVLSGTLMCYSALRPTHPRIRKTAAIASNCVWFVTAFIYLSAGEFGPVAFTSIIFFAFTSMMSLDKWDEK